MGSIEVSSECNTPELKPLTVSPSWQTPGPAAYDFRTDTITTPSYSMLQAIAQTTLGDDCYKEDETTTSFESFIAELTGKEDALLVMSGTMGNQIALRSLLTQPPYAILCHAQSHIINAEAGGCSWITGAHMQTVTPSNGFYLTLDDVRNNVVITDDFHKSPTRVISLENSLGGVITPLADIQAISRFARENDIRMHLDGARLWEVVAAGAGSLTEYLDCFDTAQLCFSKGLGAPIGSIIVGTKKILKHSRWIRKSMGGGIRMAGVISSAARVAVEEQFGRGPNGDGGKLRSTHRGAKIVESMWAERGGRVSRPVDTNMCILDLEYSGIALSDLVAVGKEEGLRFMYSRIVVHYQICEDAFVRLGRVMDRIMTIAATKGRTHEKTIYY